MQSKNWHVDVIEMNGVRGYRRYVYLYSYGFVCCFFLTARTNSDFFPVSQIKVEFSMKFTSRDLSLKRTPSKKQSGVFGVKISVVTKYASQGFSPE